MTDVREMAKDVADEAGRVAGEAGRVAEDVSKAITETLTDLSKDLGNELRRIRPAEKRDHRPILLLLVLAVIAVVAIVAGSRMGSSQETDDWA